MNIDVFQKIILEIKQQLEIKSSVIVSVCGGSCTRKSSLVSAYLADYFKDNTVLISQDQFQLQPSYIKNIDPDYKWDHPNNFEINACYDALIKLKNNQVVNVPNYNFIREAPISYKTIVPAPIIIFEGLYANYNKLQDLNDISVYVKSPWYARMIRRALRNTLDRYKGREPSTVVESFCSSVTKAHLDFVKTQETSSNFVIETPLQFDNIIAYYSLKPIEFVATKNNYFFSLNCKDNISFKINNTDSKQYEFLFSYKNKLYLKCYIDSDLAHKLKNIHWLAY
ncbi:hypothetical protein MHTCC0001_24840 [Flavobacteriaceae bacterium MHTCC 0001]